jgi:nucleoside triphosphate pyrophosphatase
MIISKHTIYLASGSPRRKKLLEQLNLRFKTLPVKIDETIFKNEKPAAAVKRLSIEKLEKAKNKIKRGIIITADTTVVLGKSIINKPRNKKDAVRMLKLLSGKTHSVYSGFAVHNTINEMTVVDYEKTLVSFRNLTKEEILEYIESGSPLDKAGAYGIQDDFGAVFVKKINGCYYNVVGLPLTKFYLALQKII